jgi:ATP-dependent DNA ligase
MPGERAMIKVKQFQTADCVGSGFCHENGSRQIGSLLLDLYDAAGKLDHVGFTSTVADEESLGLTKRLEGLRQAPGCTGKAPGDPSRWSTKRRGNENRRGLNLLSKCGLTMPPAAGFAM